MSITASARSDKGAQSHNEDSYFVPTLPQHRAAMARKGHLFIVADGVGGHEAGEVASRVAVETVSQAYYADAELDSQASLQRAIEQANQIIYETVTQQQRRRSMATTIAAAVLHEAELTIANVGDSRIYWCDNRQLKQLSVDHTWVNEQVKVGIISTEQAKTHQQRNVVLRALGTKPAVEADFMVIRLTNPHGKLLLCSDGLTDVVADHEILQALLKQPTAEAVSQTLLEMALERGAPDNVTVITVFTHHAAKSKEEPTTKLDVPLPSAESPSRQTQPRKRWWGCLLLTVLSGVAMLLLCGLLFTLLLLEEADKVTVEAMTAESSPGYTATDAPLLPPTMTTPAADTTLPLPTSTLATQGTPPSLLYPADGAQFSLSDLTQGDPLLLRWQGDTLTATGRFVVFVRDSAEQMIPLPNEGVTREPQFVLPASQLPPGDYSWLVVVEQRVAGEQIRVNRSTARQFTIVAASSAGEPLPTEQRSVNTTSLTTLYETNPASPFDLSALRLLQPQDDTILFSNQDVTFMWMWEGALPSNHQFEVRLWLADQPHYGAYDVRETAVEQADETYSVTFKPEGAESVRLNGSQENYQWAVGVVQVEPYQRLEQVESASQRIIIQVPNSSKERD